MRSQFLFLTAIAGFSAVMMGAFGAHALKSVLSVDLLAVYRTAVDYHIWHALALGLVSLFKQQQPDSRLLYWAGCLFFIGILLFSGSLYILAVFNIKWLGMITPLGGVSFLAAWLCLALFAYQKVEL